MKRRLLGGIGLGKNTVFLLHAEDFINAIDKTIVSYNNVSIAEGKFGQGFYCRGYVRIPSSVVRLLYGKNFTVDFWFKNPSIISEGTKILMLGLNSEDWVSGYGGIDLNMSSDGYLNVSLYNGSQINIEKTHVITTNTWIHIAAVVKDNTFYLFINGVLKATKSFGGYLTPLNNPYHSRIGNGVEGYFPFADKCIDEFRISNVARWTSNFIPPTKPY